MVLHLVLGKQDLAKHLGAAFLGYVIRACQQKGNAHWLCTSSLSCQAALQLSQLSELQVKGNSSIHQEKMDKEGMCGGTGTT